MKRPPKVRTPDHTQLDLDQEKYYRPFIEGYIKVLNQISSRLNTLATITATRNTPVENPMTVETQTGNHSGCSGIIVNGPDTISMLFEISYLSGWVANWFVNVRCSGMMRSAADGARKNVWG